MSGYSGRGSIGRGTGRGRHTGGRMAHSLPHRMHDPIQYHGDESEFPETTPSLPHHTPSPGESSQGSSLSSRLFIEPNGNTFLPEVEAVKKVSAAFKSKFDHPWLNFGEVPENVKDLWFAEFQKRCQWADDKESEIRKIWKHKTAELLRNNLNDIRRGKVSGNWMNNRVKDALKHRWATDPEFLRASQTNKQNIHSTTPLVHRGGGISISERRRRLEIERERPVPIPEVFSQIHFDGDNNRWHHERAATTFENYQRLVETQQSQGEEQLNEDALFFEATGGKNKKGRSVGFGSEAAFYGQGSARTGTSSTQHAAAESPAVLNLQKQVEELKGDNSAIKDQLQKILQLLELQNQRDGPPGDTSTPHIPPSYNQDDDEM